MYESSAGKNTRALTVFRGPYINLSFQDGPIPEQGTNGTTNEEVIQLLIDRIRSLDLVLPSPWNGAAIDHLEEALSALNTRTRERQARGVEGTNAP
jgi:hypothetical protein